MVKQEKVYLYILNKGLKKPKIFIHQVELYTFHHCAGSCDEPDSLIVLNWPVEGNPGFIHIYSDNEEWEPIRGFSNMLYSRERNDEKARMIFLDREKHIEAVYNNMLKDATKRLENQKALVKFLGSDLELVEVDL